MTTASIAQRSEYVREIDDDFLTLWPHRHDFLYAEHPAPNDKPNWKTESRHPLSDRLILQGAHLYGVRFGRDTRYAMLDIDAGSPYHPAADALALDRIRGALEPLGLVESVVCTSSASRGLHVYFPCDRSLRSWELALAVTTLLENAGFKVSPGLLEVFPNPKPFTSDGSISLYNGHRLPMQNGSYLLNQELDCIPSEEGVFTQRWGFAERRNAINPEAVTQVLRAARRKVYRVSGKAEKFINDLNAEIEPGWTGEGQTNYLLGRIAMRSYIFGHILSAEAPLEGDALIADIINTAMQLPGYDDFCNHCDEIEQRAEAWGRCVETSHYYHYGSAKPITLETLTVKSEPTWNDRQQSGARERIQRAVAHLLEEERLPAGITERFDALVGEGMSGATLYRHRDLWHPAHLQPVENPPNPPAAPSDGWLDCSEGASSQPIPTSLLEERGCNCPIGEGFSDLQGGEFGKTGCNSSSVAAFSDLRLQPTLEEAGVTFIQGILIGVERDRQIRVRREAARQARQREEQRQTAFDSFQRTLAQMTAWQDSGDSILVAEAEAWLNQNGFGP